MYRRPFFGGLSIASLLAVGAAQAFANLMSTDVVTRAERDNRRRDRWVKRVRRSSGYGKAGLNGNRAMERRRRQRETGHSCQAQGYV